MEFTDKDIRLIEDALLDRLSGEDQFRLAERLKDDQFSAEYERYKLMIGMVQSEGRSELKKDLQKIDKELPLLQNNKQRTIPMYVRWLVAASLIGIAGYLGIYNFNSDTNLNVYNKYHEAYPNLIDPITKGSESGYMSPYQLYESGRYEAAQREFSVLDQSEERDFYMALTYLELEDFVNAINRLSQINNNDAHRFSSEARWYLALAYIGVQNEEKAGAILIDISEQENSPFSKSASQLLKELE